MLVSVFVWDGHCKERVFACGDDVSVCVVVVGHSMSGSYGSQCR